MNERPIHFMDPMIRALLYQQKTQTRRLIKPQPDDPGTFGLSPIWGHGVKDGNFTIHAATNESGQRADRYIRCPYGATGDRLWVREAWAHVPASAYNLAHVPHRFHPDNSDPRSGSVAVYRTGWSRCKPGRWKPATYMPRWASRITLEITDVRVECVQEISETDALAEGAIWWVQDEKLGPISSDNREDLWCRYAKRRTDPDSGVATHRAAFAMLWDHIQGADFWDTPAEAPTGWVANPWCWAITFRPVEQSSAGHTSEAPK